MTNSDVPSVAMVYPQRPHGPSKSAENRYGHPAHRGFARTIDATDVPLDPADVPPDADSALVSDLVSAMVTSIPERDVYVLENDSVLYLAPRLRRTQPDSTIVLLAAADRVLTDTRPTPVEGNASWPTGDLIDTLADRHLLRTFLGHYCDGVIAVSGFVAECIGPLVPPGTPVGVATPYVQPAVYERLHRIRPDLAAPVAVTVGQWRDHKGIDMLVDAWPRVRGHHPDARLRIVGPGHPAHYAETPGVTVVGFVPDLGAELPRASLYVHPARLEPFGVSVLEAMCAGVPAIVTTTTGARTAVREVDESLVVDPSPSALAAAVTRYFDADLAGRTALSERSRRATEPYTEARKTRHFRREFRSLLGALGRRAPADTATSGERRYGPVYRPGPDGGQSIDGSP